MMTRLVLSVTVAVLMLLACGDDEPRPSQDGGAGGAQGGAGGQIGGGGGEGGDGGEAGAGGEACWPSGTSCDSAQECQEHCCGGVMVSGGSGGSPSYSCL